MGGVFGECVDWYCCYFGGLSVCGGIVCVGGGLVGCVWCCGRCGGVGDVVGVDYVGL